MEKMKELYTIGRKKMEAQKVGEMFSCVPTDSSAKEYSGNFSRSWNIWFGIDDKGTRYMALAMDEWGVGEWRGAHKSGGHWHSAGCNHFIMGYNVYLRKNFSTKEEANKFYNLIKIHFDHRTFQDSDNKKYTEAELFGMFR